MQSILSSLICPWLNHESLDKFLIDLCCSYIEAEEIDGATFWGESAFYPGGGFLVRLDGNKDDTMKKIQNLKNEKFLDHYTRAVFHEFAVYNPTYNLFAVVTMVAEFRASSGMFAYYYCEPLRLIMYHGPTAPYQVY